MMHFFCLECQGMGTRKKSVEGERLKPVSNNIFKIKIKIYLPKILLRGLEIRNAVICSQFRHNLNTENMVIQYTTVISWKPREGPWDE